MTCVIFNTSCIMNMTLESLQCGKVCISSAYARKRKRVHCFKGSKNSLSPPVAFTSPSSIISLDLRSCVEQVFLHYDFLCASSEYFVSCNAFVRCLLMFWKNLIHFMTLINHFGNLDICFFKVSVTRSPNKKNIIHMIFEW